MGFMNLPALPRKGKKVELQSSMSIDIWCFPPAAESACSLLGLFVAGGPAFNFLGFGRSENNLRDLQIKEVKNGRLAMIAVLGFGAQAVLTRQGPFQNLLDHLANPTANNILTNFGRIYNQ